MNIHNTQHKNILTVSKWKRMESEKSATPDTFSYVSKEIKKRKKKV